MNPNRPRLQRTSPHRQRTREERHDLLGTPPPSRNALASWPHSLHFLAQEIIALPEPSASVVQIADVGNTLGTDNPLVKLRSGEPYVTIRVGMADLGRFPKGQEVDIQAPTDTATSTAGRVDTISDFKGADGAGSGPGYDVEIVVPVPGDLAEAPTSSSE